MLDQVLKSYLEHICGASNVRENEPMSAHTTFKIGGPARFFITVQSKQTLLKLVSALNYIEYPYRVIGGGSNLLAPDRGYDGVIIKLGFREIVENGNFIYADAGAPLSALVKFARERDLSGLEFAAGIPGTVGGAIFMNAGAHGGAISDVVTMVDVLRDGQIVSLDTRACKFAYRTSVFQRKRNWVILGTYFFLYSRPLAEVPPRTNQPKEPNAGSVFKNPIFVSSSKNCVSPPLRKGECISAGKLIDQLGLKGFVVGGAAISERHANFIINKGFATARDVRALVKLVKTKVRVAYGINLKTEIEFL